jgi:GcrA cell cycle regulator
LCKTNNIDEFSGIYYFNTLDNEVHLQNTLYIDKNRYMSWTDDKVKKLRELWTKGHTASQIAGLLGETTRNAVIGKAHRLNLEERAPSKTNSSSEKKQTNNSQPKLRGSASRKSKFNSILLDKTFEPENPTVLENLTDQTCKWPSGHPDEENFYFCGRKPVDAFPYCKLHVLYAFQPKGQKEENLTKDDELPSFIKKKIKSA